MDVPSKILSALSKAKQKKLIEYWLEWASNYWLAQGAHMSLASPGCMT
jgi:hypothetical protein